uniref:Aquaporin-9 n=1 Tax=Steinernema glaseri TaxID=37863 RepID=A0A1I7YD23_9BILA
MLDVTDRLRKKLRISNEFARSVLCEFVCTTFLIYGGTAVTAQYVLSRTRYNAYIGVTLGWGFSLVFAVQLGMRISGSHLNPAVSLFLFSFGKISFARFLAYTGAQMAGGFFGAALTYTTYYDALNAFDHGKRYVTGPLATASIFATYPQPYLSMAGGIIDQIAGTVMLCICVSLITDKRNGIPSWLQPLYIGLTIMLVGMAVGMNSGYAVNPARDFGPRLFTFCAGYGLKVFSYNNYCWFWIPIVAPLLGALIGSWAYQLFIGIHMPEEEEVPTQVVYKPHPPQILDVRSVQVDNDYKRSIISTSSIGSDNYYTRR